MSAKLGEGGMGAVYRARDSRLNRDVAIKVLLPHVAGDADRLARFRREAQLLAALNHPQIAQIYGFEDGNDIAALVLELVEGPTLADRIVQGAIPLDEALPIAKQVANALEAAHEQGIVHRDLKPANIKVRTDGTVKVLDFGLAKAMEPSNGSSASVSMSPTLTVHATQAGVILGTAAYMSPEQARGKSVDKRADIWAFGAVLFEMLTGRPAFPGDDVSHVLARVIEREPDWNALPASLPPSLVTCLRRCLVKDPRQRMRDVGDVRLALEGAFDTTGAADQAAPVNRPFGWRQLTAVGVVAAAVAGLVPGAVVWRLRPVPAIVKFPIVLGDNQEFTRPPSIAVSPDGSHVAYVANQRLYVRPIDEMEARPIPGTEVDPIRPFFSPDGQWIGFFAFLDSSLKKVALSGGPPVTIYTFPDTVPGGGTWYGNDIVFADSTKGIMRVSAAGGVPSMIAEVTPPETADGPVMLDDDTVLFTTTVAAGNDRWDKGAIVVHSLGSGERKIVLRGGTAAFVTAAHLVYAVGSTLLAVPFDRRVREVRGGPVPVLEGVRRAGVPAIMSGTAGAALSATGTLLHLPGNAPGAGLNTLAFAHRDGTIAPLPLPPQSYMHPRVSPRGNQLAVAIVDNSDANIWIIDLASGSPARRLTFGGRNLYPIWTPDGQFITFQSDREGDRGIFRQRADGSGVADRLTRAALGAQHAPESWSPDGKTLTFRAGSSVASIFTLTIGDAVPKRFDDSITGNHFDSSFSPDGRWLAYSSLDGERVGGTRIFVQPFPRTGARYQVVSTFSEHAQWSPDGKQLLYSDGPLTGRLMMVDMRTTGTVSFGNPTPIPTPGIDKPPTQSTWRPYDVLPDGKRILIVQAPADSRGATPRRQINVVLNWFEELKRRVP